MRLTAHLLAPDGGIPNHPRWPLLVYADAVPVEGSDPAAAFEDLFGRHGWPAAWRNGVHPFHHYHPDGHEALGIYAGEVTVRFGGEGGVTLVAQPGDVIVLPAGTGHKKLSSKGALGVVGAYPRGQHPATRVPALARLAAAQAEVARVPLPELDPVCGAHGPLFEHWRAPGAA